MPCSGVSPVRIILCFGCLLAVSSLVRGEDPTEAKLRLSVYPMAASKPLLKYQLLPDMGEMQPGNGAQWYLRCFAEQRYFFFSKQGQDERNQLLQLPLSEIPVDKYPNYGGNALKQADWAARLDTIDWQVLQRLQTEGLELTQPELDPLLILARSLQARFRVEIAARRYDDAIRTAKTLFAFARHLGENPTEKACRLGLTVADLTLDTLEEMVQQKDCPNLYWALSDLPLSLVNIRKAVQTNASLVTEALKPVRDDTCMTNEQVEKVVALFSGLAALAREEEGRKPKSFRGALAARIKTPEQIKALREQLVKDGAAEGLVPNFPPIQGLLMQEKRLYEAQRDDRLKLLSLPLWEIDALAQGDRKAEGLLADLLPPVLKLRKIQGRFEQRIAALRLVEGMRMFSADHAGKLPGKLPEITVPLPADPFTGKPFPCEVDGSSIRIPCGSLKGEAKALQYEVQLVTRR